MKFGSWTYDGFKVNCDLINQCYPSSIQLDLKLKDAKGDLGAYVDNGDLGTYVDNGEWHLLGKVWKKFNKSKINLEEK